MTDSIVVISTCATEADAERLARALIEARLVACVSVVPQVRSFYRWKGQVESVGEFLLLMKTSRESFGALSAAMEKLHPYELPELLALPVVAGPANYLNWLAGNLGTGE
jgi:periplasmic divalent cation tolerance protein